MQQHPVPQHIASYEFRLVGDMTLKQFLQVAGGGLVALLFYAAPLPVIIKWPLIFIFGAAGAALAFLPVEERPLSDWFLAFLRAIYSPTQYTYDPRAAKDIFAPESQAVSGVGAAEAYLSHPALTDEQEIKNLEEQEQTFFQKALSLFHLTKGVPAPSVNAPAAPAPRPQLIVEQVPSIYTPPPTFAEASVGKQPTPFTPSAVGEQLITQPQVAPASNAAGTLDVPPIFPPTPPERRGPGRPRLTTPRFEISANPPMAPGIPNVIVGQILDSAGSTVEAAILEIKDSGGRPVRALRSNKVGHFLTATPLEPGTYEIITEKEGLVFDPIQVTTTSEIIQPLEIKAKSPNQ